MYEYYFNTLAQKVQFFTPNSPDFVKKVQTRQPPLNGNKRVVKLVVTLPKRTL